MSVTIIYLIYQAQVNKRVNVCEEQLRSAQLLVKDTTLKNLCKIQGIDSRFISVIYRYGRQTTATDA